MDNMEKYIIYMDSFEIGMVMGAISEKRSKIPDLWNQLIDYVRKFKEKDGVMMSDLGHDMVRLRDKHGNEIIREKYDWE